METRDKRLFSTSDYARIASTEMLSGMTTGYFNSGADDEHTMKVTQEAFDQFKLRQRTFVDETKWKGMHTTMFGKQVASPLCIAPLAFQKLAHPEGEVALARACQAFNKTPMFLSSIASTSIEDVSQAAPDSMKIYQLYLSRIPAVNQDIYKRARDSGYCAFAVTIDAVLSGKRIIDVKNKFALPPHIRLENLIKYVTMGQDVSVQDKEGSGLVKFVRDVKNNFLEWQDLKQIRNDSGMPLIVKGIMTADDTRKALENDADGVCVSNHGARSLDTTPATIEVLAEVCEEVRAFAQRHNTKPATVWFDGGIRNGRDIVKAIALGADYVCLGRQILFGLTCGG